MLVIKINPEAQKGLTLPQKLSWLLTCGGTKEIIWGPDLDFIEDSQSDDKKLSM